MAYLPSSLASRHGSTPTVNTSDRPDLRAFSGRLAKLLRLLVPALLLIGAVACETQAPYASCTLDPEVTNKGVCKGEGSTGGATTSCVVTRHPHCVESICLSYFSTESVCTHACSADSDCEQGGWCWPFSETASYCVPADRKDVAK